MEKNHAIKTGVWLAVMISSLMLLVLCTMCAMHGGPANQRPHEILTEPLLFPVLSFGK